MDIAELDPAYRDGYRRVPALPLHRRWAVLLARRLFGFAPAPKIAPAISVTNERFGDAAVRVYRPDKVSGAALLWIHGGGLVIGRPEQNDAICVDFARQLNLVVVSVRYRLAPENRYPAAIDDCLAAWSGLLERAGAFGIDVNRIVVAGQSAGGGLAACLAQRVRDAGGPQPAGQLLFCPMLDDRTAARRELDPIKYFLWTNRANRSAWTWYLGVPPGSSEIAPYAAAARQSSLQGLPPAWISAGELELFHDEIRDYARRLQASGVTCQLQVVPRAAHAVELMAPQAPAIRELWGSAYRFLGESLCL